MTCTLPDVSLTPPSQPLPAKARRHQSPERGVTLSFIG